MNDELEGVVHQLLRVCHNREEIGLDVQSVDRDFVGVVSLLLRDEIQEFAGSENGLNLLL